MKSLIIKLIVFSAVLLPALPVFASSGRSFWAGIFYSTINFTVLVVLLVWLSKKGIKAFFFKRSEEIQSALDKAQAAQLEAEAKAREMQERLDGLDKTIQEIADETKSLAEKEKEAIIKRAKGEAVRIREDAERQVAREIQEALLAIKKELVEKSLEEAQAILKKEWSSADQNRFFDEVVSQVSRLPKS